MNIEMLKQKDDAKLWIDTLIDNIKHDINIADIGSNDITLLDIIDDKDNETVYEILKYINNYLSKIYKDDIPLFEIDYDKNENLLNWSINHKDLAHFIYYIKMKKDLIRTSKRKYLIYERMTNKFRISINTSTVKYKISYFIEIIEFAIGGGFNVNNQTGQDKFVRKQCVDYLYKLIENNIQITPMYEKDIFKKFSNTYPQYVQFNDLVYDTKNHKVAKMEPYFKIRYIHRGSIETGLTKSDIENLPVDESLNHFSLEEILNPDETIKSKFDSLFVDIPITINEIKTKSALVLERFEEIYFKEDMPLLITILGSMFDNNATYRPVLITSQDNGQCLGKRYLYGIISSKIFSATMGSYFSKGWYSFERKYNKYMNLINDFEFFRISSMFKDDFNNKFMKFVKEDKRFITIATDNVLRHSYVPDKYKKDKTIQSRLIYMPLKKSRYDLVFDFREKYKEAKLYSQLGAFIMYCLMTYRKYKNEFNILEKKGVLTKEGNPLLSNRTYESSKLHHLGTKEKVFIEIEKQTRKNNNV